MVQFFWECADDSAVPVKMNIQADHLGHVKDALANAANKKVRRRKWKGEKVCDAQWRGQVEDLGGLYFFDTSVSRWVELRALAQLVNNADQPAKICCHEVPGLERGERTLLLHAGTFARAARLSEASARGVVER